MAFTQNEIRTHLLTVYSGNSMAAIDDQAIADTFYPGKAKTVSDTQAIIEELTLNSVYLNIITELKDFKESIEEEVARAQALSPEDELRTILYEVVLNRAIYFGYSLDQGKYNYKMQLLFDLIKGAYINSGKWEEKLDRHFEYV